MELAIATHTHPDQWADTDPRIVATAVAVLQEAHKKRGR